MKNFFKKRLPDFKEVSKIKALKKLNIGQTYLWHFSRRSVSTAFFIGLFWTMMPIPFQMVPATMLAIYIRANLPITLALVWITNPLTIPFIFYLNYRLGTFILNIAPSDHLGISSWQSITQFTSPLLVGCLISGFVFSLLSYLIINWSYIAYIRRKQNKRAWRNNKEDIDS